MLGRIIQFLASLKLTVVCLAAALLLVFIGTLAQVDQGLYQAQNRYFRSFLVFWSPPGAGWRIPIFPGGYLVGSVLLINLLAAQILRFEASRKKIGIYIVHAGIILLLLGQLATDFLQVESHMRLREGESKSYSESDRRCELVVLNTTDPKVDQAVAIPESVLARRQPVRNAALPFTIHVVKYLPNSRLAERAASRVSETPSATQGLGRQLLLDPEPVTTKLDEQNLPSAVVELVSPQGSLGTWLVSLMLNERQPVSVAGKTFELALRLVRHYKPYSLELVQFRHDKYKGTNIPKNFSSRVRVKNPATGEDREVLIYMNNPLRYGGETYYQSGYDENDPRVTILQVVRNPGWLTPYISCLMVGAGLAWHFLMHLTGFLKERKTT